MADWLSDKKLVAATLETGVATNGDAGNYKFANGVRLCLIANNSAACTFLVRGNRSAHTDGAQEASTTAFEELVKPGTVLELGRDGRRTINDLSIFFSGVVNAGEVQIWGLP